MRRSRTLREYREKLRRNRVLSNSERKEVTIKQLMAAKNKSRVSREKLAMQLANRRRLKQKQKQTNPIAPVITHEAVVPITSDVPSFIGFHDYQYKSRPVNVLHIIESLGMGGAQTMMMELVNGLNIYYGKHINNKVMSLVGRVKNLKIQNGQLYKSYGVIPEQIDHSMLKRFCKENSIDVVLHHRLSISKCIRKHLPNNVRYVLLNHTWNNLDRVPNFKCDFFVSVCDFLHKKTPLLNVPSSRHLMILNGVENSNNIKPVVLPGNFNTGRCHRLVPSKFDVNSIKWMDQNVATSIPEFKHYIIGSHAKAKILCNKSKSVKYLGPILNRNKKMSIIKAFDVYFYETFFPEGASVAILESLASGVPVICKPLGGNTELVRQGVNGFIVGDRPAFLLRMKQLAEDRQKLEELRESTRLDFENRLHIKHTACKYIQLFEHLIK